MILDLEVRPEGCEARAFVTVVNSGADTKGYRTNLEASVVCGDHSQVVRFRPQKDIEDTHQIDDFDFGRIRDDLTARLGSMCLNCPNNSNAEATARPLTEQIQPPSS